MFLKTVQSGGGGDTSEFKSGSLDVSGKVANELIEIDTGLTSLTEWVATIINPAKLNGSAGLTQSCGFLNGHYWYSTAGNGSPFYGDSTSGYEHGNARSWCPAPNQNGKIRIYMTPLNDDWRTGHIEWMAK